MNGWKILLLLVFLAFPGLVHAVNPDEILADPVMEERARIISKQVRCVVCQNESIDESNAELARDLRVVIRDKLSQGASDEQIFSFLVERYGAFILLMPPFSWKTAVLWIGPAVLVLAGGGAAVFYFRRRKQAPGEPPLSDEEKERLSRVLKGEQTP